MVAKKASRCREVTPAAAVATLTETMKRRSRPSRKPHKHLAVTTYLLHQVDGVPYEIERTVCDRCGRVLGTKPLRRAHV